jgi:radical SAM protein with 4Fe4S-binding SPASM domain
MTLAPEFYSSLDEDCSTRVSQARLATTCGLGMNLYIGPGGECFPCYALTGAVHALGNALEDGLTTVLARNDAYRRVSVDSNEKCSTCTLRYLCGGFCRAWGCAPDPDSPPTDCKLLHERAKTLLESAISALEISAEQWRAAGLSAE